MATKKPQRVVLFAYQVGFGDCFLLRFDYGSSLKHILIDFGTTGLPTGVSKDRMLEIANDIAAKCNNKLDGIVATHRHADHISGFATNKTGTGPGDVIRALKPKVVVQPWTEDPKLKTNAKAPTAVESPALKGFMNSMSSMHEIAHELTEMLKLGKGAKIAPGIRDQLAFLGEDNLANLNAVKNLMTMSQDNKYIFHGSKSGLEKVLPGVKIDVLGPPTLKQTDTISAQRSRDKDEFWQLTRMSMAADRQLSSGSVELFPGHPSTVGNKLPLNARWLADQLKSMRSEQMLQLVRILDKQMNNTSVILLFEVGGKKFLFSGDAQIENWEFALSKPEVLKKLVDVDVYKVGHHGSLNATPKTLWGNFGNKGGKSKSDRMTSIVSTMPGKHGSVERNTEVPRRPLMTSLKANSNVFNTNELGATKLYWEIEFEV